MITIPIDIVKQTPPNSYRICKECKQGKLRGRTGPGFRARSRFIGRGTFRETSVPQQGQS